MPVIAKSVGTVPKERIRVITNAPISKLIIIGSTKYNRYFALKIIFL
jgi:hypothetical protein